MNRVLLVAAGTCAALTGTATLLTLRADAASSGVALTDIPIENCQNIPDPSKDKGTLCFAEFKGVLCAFAASQRKTAAGVSTSLQCDFSRRKD